VADRGGGEDAADVGFEHGEHSSGFSDDCLLFKRLFSDCQATA